MLHFLQRHVEPQEPLFGDVNVEDGNYYKPILVKTSFKNNYKYYESRGDKDKNPSVKQYLYKIMPYLSDLINDHKAIRIILTNGKFKYKCM